MLKPFELTERQWNKYCDFGMEGPFPLGRADLTRSFIYERRQGVFYVPGGMHQSVMSFLLALHHSCQSGVEVANLLGLEYSSGTADYWLETAPGAAFRTSVGEKRIIVAANKGLTPLERRLFGNFVCAGS